MATPKQISTYLPTYEKIFNDTSILAAMTPSFDRASFGNLSNGEATYSEGFLHPTPDGLLVQVSHGRDGVVASKTVYLVSQPTRKIEAADGPTVFQPLLGRFNQAQNIVVEVEFHSPNCSVNGKPALNIWAVGLNIKNGDAQDKGDPDDAIGPTCRFKNGGDVYLGMTDYLMDVDPKAQVPMSNQPATHVQYGSSLTPFKLRFEMHRTVDSSGVETDTGLGELTIGNQTISENLKVPDLKSAAKNPASLSAIGFAVVNLPSSNPASEPDATVSVVITAFRITMW